MVQKYTVTPLKQNILSRPRLISKLNEGMDKKLLIVTAPAGYGKTTTVRLWLEQLEAIKIWFSLDEEDNDPVRFWKKVSQSLITKGLLENRAKISTQYYVHVHGQQVDHVLSVIVDRLEKMGSRLVVVFDDFHLIHEKVIHQALRSYIKQLPDSVRIVFISRSDPPLSLHRLRLEDQLDEIRLDDLRFSPLEIAAFFDHILKVSLPSSQVQMLETSTEGWIAGLQLVSLFLKDQTNLLSQMDSFNGKQQFIAEYLTEEVLKSQPEDIRLFLLQTSILERLEATLCQAVTGLDQAGEILQTIIQNNLFVIPLDYEQHWFRYHHLFQEMLQGHLVHSSFNERELHQKASDWYKKNHFPLEAIKHALLAESWETAIDIFLEVAPDLLKRGEISTIFSLMDKIPEAELDQKPLAQILHAWSLALSGHLEKAQMIGYRLEKQLPLEAAHDEQLKVELYFLLGVLSVLRKQLPLAMHQLKISTSPESEYKSKFFDAGIEMNLGEVDIIRSALGLGGRLKMVEELFSYLRDIWKNRGSAILGYGSLMLGQLYYEWNDMEKVSYFVSRGIQIGKTYQKVGVFLPIYLLYAKYKKQQEGVAGAQNVLEELEKELHQWAPSAHWEEIIQAFRIRLSIEVGDREKVELWVQNYQDVLKRYFLPIHEFLYLTLARAYLFLGWQRNAMQLLNRLQYLAETEDRLGSRIEVLLLKALFHTQVDNEKEALTLLSEALTLAQPENYIRTFVDLGQPLEELLQTLSQQESKSISKTMKEYIHHILQVYQLDRGDNQEAYSTFTGESIKILTYREREVLRYIKKGFTNKEIGKEMDIKAGTVKVHISNIFSKLGVKSRTQALSKIDEFQLLDREVEEE